MDYNEQCKKAYYHGIFKIHEIEIIAKQRFFSVSLERNYYRYLIRFKNGKLKYIHENHIIVP